MPIPPPTPDDARMEPTPSQVPVGTDPNTDRADAASEEWPAPMPEPGVHDPNDWAADARHVKRANELEAMQRSNGLRRRIKAITTC